MSDTLRNYQRLLHDQLPDLEAKYHVLSLGIFGSFLHGTEHEGSDLDLLVTFDVAPSLLRLIELENHLSDSLGVKVDLVPRNSLKPHVAENVLREVLPV